MALHFAASVLHEYPLIWKKDPALRQPEIPPKVEPFADEPPDAFAARKDARDKAAKEAQDAFDLAYRNAVETGRWDMIRRPDAQPTVFVCRPIPGSTYRAFIDYMTSDASGIGDWQARSLAFRLAVIRIDNFAPGFKVERVEHLDKHGNPTGLGKVLCDAAVNVLDDLDTAIVSSLGLHIIANRGGPHPL